jgi:hypothetical protein
VKKKPNTLLEAWGVFGWRLVSSSAPRHSCACVNRNQMQSRCLNKVFLLLPFLATIWSKEGVSKILHVYKTGWFINMACTGGEKGNGMERGKKKERKKERKPLQAKYNCWKERRWWLLYLRCRCCCCNQIHAKLRGFRRQISERESRVLSV